MFRCRSRDIGVWFTESLELAAGAEILNKNSNYVLFSICKVKQVRIQPKYCLSLFATSAVLNLESVPDAASSAAPLYKKENRECPVSNPLRGQIRLSEQELDPIMWSICLSVSGAQLSPAASPATTGPGVGLGAVFATFAAHLSRGRTGSRTRVGRASIASRSDRKVLGCRLLSQPHLFSPLLLFPLQLTLPLISNPGFSSAQLPLRPP